MGKKRLELPLNTADSAVSACRLSGRVRPAIASGAGLCLQGFRSASPIKEPRTSRTDIRAGRYLSSPLCLELL
jgi:hypothetical protein